MSSSRHSMNTYALNEMKGVPPLTPERFDALMRGDGNDDDARHSAGRWSASTSIKSVPPVSPPPPAAPARLVVDEHPKRNGAPPPPPPPPPPPEHSGESTERRHMSVSIYASDAGGRPEVVIKATCSSLDVFLVSLGDALAKVAQKTDAEHQRDMFTSLIKNAYPVMLALSGYKTDRVFEARVLVCGSATLEDAHLLAESSV